MPLIVLWDVDHTLIENSGVSKEIYAAAFEQLTDRQLAYRVVTEGRTDRLIMADLFSRHGLVMPPWRAVEKALAGSGGAREAELARRGFALPGAAEALKKVAAVPGWVSSVLTGNIEANARVKLRAFGLDRLVDLRVGGFGADGVHRAELVPVARRRVGAAYGLAPGTPVVLLGDTPRDVEAGRLAGAAVIGVASGSYGADELLAAGARAVVPDLRDSAEVLSLLEDCGS